MKIVNQESRKIGLKVERVVLNASTGPQAIGLATSRSTFPAFLI
jgi:hypothetical protein